MPVDCQVKCYEVAFISPARESMERMSKRLPLLKKMLESGKVLPGVIERIVPSIEDDIRTLSSEKELKMLDEVNRDAAVEMRDDVKKTLGAIKKLLEKEPVAK
jgi:hypothetical protein